MKSKMRKIGVCFLAIVCMMGTLVAYASNSASGSWSYTSKYVSVSYYVSIVNGVLPLKDKVWCSLNMSGSEASTISKDDGAYCLCTKNTTTCLETTLYKDNLSEALSSSGYACGYVGNTAILSMCNLCDDMTPKVVSVSD